MMPNFLKHWPFAVAKVADDGRFLDASPGFPALLGISMEKLLTLRYQEVTHPDDLEPDLEKHRALLRGDIDSYNMRKRYLRSNGEWLWVFLEVGVDKSTSTIWAHISEIAAILPQPESAALYNAIDRALRLSELYLEYQPIVNLKTRKIVAYEALIRWKVDGKLIAPDDWLPKLDATIHPKVDLWVFRQVCLDRIKQNSPDHVAFAANISPVSLKVDGFVDELLKIPGEVGVEPAKIWCEITEQTGHPSNIAILIKLFQNQGHQIAVDDFGAGSSNLASLVTYAANVIKIDKTIVRELPSYSAVQVINMLVSASKSIPTFKLVCEGIEDEDTARLVSALGVEMGQGWLFGKPGPLP